MKEKVVTIAKKIPNGKIYLEIITAALSIPVLLSVIFLNLNSLKKPNTPTPTPTPKIEKSIIYIPQANTLQTTPTSSLTPTSPVCQKDIGPVNITSPAEGTTVTENPLSFVIDYSDKDYCAVVWSYKINDGAWSNFTSNNPVIYNLPNGNIKFYLKVQSTVTQKEETLTRNFIYSGTNNSASSSATIQ